jgi:naringenin degradation protein FdeI
MKLATFKDGTRDGTLVAVSRDLARAAPCADIAPNLREALERWDGVAARLEARCAALEAGIAPGISAFDPRLAAAPLPRSFGWLDGSAFQSHGELMIRAFGLAPDIHDAPIPLMYQGASDDFLGPRDDVPLPDEADGIDFEAEIGVVTGDVPMGARAAEAGRHIRLVVLLNDISLRALAPREMATGFGFLQSKATTSFAPAAVTPDELGPAWRDGRLHLPVRVDWNDARFGAPQAGAMRFSFPELVAHAARTRRLSAGTVIGSGTVSNAAHRAVGSACIAERRAIEMLDHGAPRTGFMRFGDRVRVEVLDEAGRTVFGAIDQRVVPSAG